MKQKWFSQLLEELKNYKTEVILVELKDGLFLDPLLRKEFENAFLRVEFYTTEIKLRKALRVTDVQVLVVFDENHSIPYELLNKYPKVDISFGRLFPLLECSALDWLSFGELHELIYEYERGFRHYIHLSELETLRYVVQVLYRIDLLYIQKENIIAFLIKYYFDHDELCGTIRKYIGGKAMDWQIDIVDLSSQTNFFSWLNVEWRRFFTPDEGQINFNDQSIKYLLMECFEQTLLKPIDSSTEKVDAKYLSEQVQANHWLGVGVINLARMSILHHIDTETKKLTEMLERDLVSREWGMVAKLWSNLVYQVNANDLGLSLRSLEQKVDTKFTQFIIESYNNLAYDQRFYHAPLNNLILPHICEQSPEKFALICFDGMSFKEWFIIKEYLITALDIAFKESFALAMIPTVTGLSRRAIFSGKLPTENVESPNEEKEFRAFVTSESQISSEEIYFQKLRDPQKPELLGYRAVGMIYNFIDELSHNAFNEKMLFESLKTYLEDSQLAEAIQKIRDEGFKIYFASDHGHLLCQGNGVNLSRYLVEDKALRAAIYEYKNLAMEFDFPGKLFLHFPNILGEWYIVTMKDRMMFGNSGIGISHGGPNIEEVVIPFIEVIK